jgi:hypothetical protein
MMCTQEFRQRVLVILSPAITRDEESRFFNKL